MAAEATYLDEDFSYAAAPAALVFGDDPEWRSAMAAAAKRMGGRVVTAAPIADAAARLDAQVGESVVLIGAHKDAGEALDALFDAVRRQGEAGRVSAVVSVAPELIDLAAARAAHPRITLVCSPSPAEEVAALARTLAGLRPALVAEDSGVEGLAPRLQQLSREVSRIAEALTSLSSERPERAPLPRHRPSARPGERPIDAAQVRAIIRARRLREQFFDADLFADPAWDMLLDLTAARLEGRQVAVSSLCIAAAVPATTALRWIRSLTENGTLLRVADPDDGRRVFISLSDSAADAMLSYLATAQRLDGPSG